NINNIFNTGIFSYSYNKKTKKGWIILKVINNIGNILYDELIKRDKKTLIEKQFHISVVRGEPILNKRKWFCYNNDLIRFNIKENIIYNNDKYYWIDIQCPFLHLVRQELDLSYNPKYPFHLTIAKRISSNNIF
ncbi:hypothetical protein V6O07_10580, partial [Arthrospira platensis SPKY2]